MIPIHIHAKIDSETLHLPELKPLIGKTVEITVTEVVPATRDCTQAQPAAPFNRQDLESIRNLLTPHQYDALVAIASAGGPDAEAISQFRAASMP